MAVYVIYKAHGDPVGEPSNEVYFQYHLEEAITFLDFKNASGEHEWQLAEVIPTDSWVLKLFRWIYKKVGN